MLSPGAGGRLCQSETLRAFLRYPLSFKRAEQKTMKGIGITGG